MWLQRWICTVPKNKGVACTLNSVRPISLYEVLRKVWTGLIAKKIETVWRDTGALDPAQYAYTKDTGADMEIIQIMNALQEAMELKQDLFHVSFDTAKAFDSALKALVVAALMRLGVPQDIAQYLIDLDKDGKTIVKTQFAAEMLRKFGMAAAVLEGQSTFSVVLAFIAVNGIGQGDTTSSTIWKVIY